MSLPFFKYQGAGNDFVLIEDFSCSPPWQEEGVIRRLCSRRLGIGADGVLLLQSSSLADVKMRIFNADGSQAAMCGNGLRCLALHAKHLGFSHKVLVETLAGVYECLIEEEGIVTVFPVPHFRVEDLEVEGVRLSVVEAGVSHAVLFVKDLVQYPVVERGRMIRYHSLFAPAGVNVNFVEPLSSSTLAIRTYERGVEEETLACGTGSLASAFVFARRQGLTEVEVRTRGHVSLFCEFKEQSVEVRGPAALVFVGELSSFFC